MQQNDNTRTDRNTRRTYDIEAYRADVARLDSRPTLPGPGAPAPTLSRWPATTAMLEQWDTTHEPPPPASAAVLRAVGLSSRPPARTPR